MSKGIRISQRRILRYLCMSRGRNDQQMPSENHADNFLLNKMKSTIEIRNMKLHEENKHGSMQNCEAVRKLVEMVVLKLFSKWRN